PSTSEGEKTVTVTTAHGTTTTSAILVVGFYPVMSFRFDGSLVDDWDSSVAFESPYATPTWVSGTTYSSAVNRGSCGSIPIIGTTNRCPFYINAAGAAKTPSSTTYSGLKSNLTVAFRMRNASTSGFTDSANFNFAFVKERNEHALHQTASDVYYGYHGVEGKGFYAAWLTSSSGDFGHSDWFGTFSGGLVNNYIFQVADTQGGFSTKLYQEGNLLQTESYGTTNINRYALAKTLGFNLDANNNGYMDFILIFNKVMTDFEVSKLNAVINNGTLYSHIFQHP
ncbi:MAG: hypothetical protein LBK50_02500, partial [Candidatus Nomurabacteria bacterium]|nr:hypothetical protein [Candidatus Nomurabacteria bacterium]